MDRLGEAVWEIISELKLVEKTDLQCCGVTPYQGYLLMQLCDGDLVSMQQLAKKNGVAVSTMTRNIEKLEAGGLAKRVKSTKDARISLVELTEQGRSIGDAVSTAWQSYFNRIASNLDREQEAAVLYGLQALLDAMKLAGNCCEEKCEEE